MTGEKPKAYFKAELIVSFELPGVTWDTHGGRGGADQLDNPFNETWRIRVTAENAAETAEQLRLVADEIDRVSRK